MSLEAFGDCDGDHVPCPDCDGKGEVVVDCTDTACIVTDECAHGNARACATCEGTGEVFQEGA
jgi:hypothetical protein